jgi:hypothetical protein
LPENSPQHWYGAVPMSSSLARLRNQLASAGFVDLVGDRHEQFRVFQSEAPWTPWFLDVAWDHTWILADYERLRVSVLCKTDTD